MIAFSCQDIRKSETVKMNTFQKNKSMQISHRDTSNFICQKIIKKFRLISKLNLGWLVNLIYVNFWPKFQSVNQQIYVNFDISKITNLRDSRQGAKGPRWPIIFQFPALRRPWSSPFCALFQLAVPLSATWDFGTEARPVDQVQSDSWTRSWNLKLLIHLSTCNRNMWLKSWPWTQLVFIIFISWSRSAPWFGMDLEAQLDFLCDISI